MTTMKSTTHSSHWGSFVAEGSDDRFTGVRPFPGDPAPSPIITGMPEAVHSRVRVDRPYVRKGWLRGDRAGGTLRGGEPFVPVDWDTAIRLVSGEIARVREQHGCSSIFGGSNGWSSAGRFHHAKSQLQRMLAATGGYTGGLTNYSYGAGMTLMPHLVGSNECIEGPVADWRAICQNAKVMLCFGGVLLRNGQIINGGGGRHDMEYWLRTAAEAGVRIVYVSPLKSDMPPLGSEWIPIRPGTDTAMMLAMAHVLIAEDRFDRQFVDKYTVGFAALRDEVIGKARTPDWAAAITGVPAETIRRLALQCFEMPSMLTANWSLQRAEFGEQPFWALMSLACLIGGIGKPGLGFSFGHGSMGGMGSPRSPIKSVGLPALKNPTGSNIPAARIADMLEKPGQPYDYNGERKIYPEIRLIHWAGGNPFHHHQDLNRFQRAWARTETIIVQEPWWTALARHADIVLPATTTLERNDIASSSRDRFIIAMKRVVRPQGQARDDYEMLSDVADSLGAREAYTEGRTEMQWLQHLYETCRRSAALKNVAIPEFDRFWSEGQVEIAMPVEEHVPFLDFVNNPSLHPLKTPSGLLEIGSQKIADFKYSDCPGYATWLEPTEYLGSSLALEFPLHLLSVQPSTRLHGQLDMAGISKAGKIRDREPIVIHEVDAKARGLEEGDIVRVFNHRGACLAGLRISRDLLPGVVVLATGAWFDPLEPGNPGSICVHGNPNVLTNDVGTSRLGQGSSAQSCLVQVERWLEPLPDIKVHERPAIEEASPA